MRRGHFEALKPLCPRCLVERGAQSPLVLAEVIAENGSGIREGLLHCTFDGCQLEYPIIDGLPILVPDARAYVADNLVHIMARGDLSATLEGVLGDCAGPGSVFDTTRQHLSSYCWDHYADLDPQEDAGDVMPGSILRCLERGLRLAEGPIGYPALDIGCSVGRSAFALAVRENAGLVLGIDLHYPMLSVARRVLDEGRVCYPRRRVGVVYDRREFPVRFEGAERVDFWVCDALALPFAAGSFGFAAALNVIDCVASPLGLLQSLAGILRDGGHTLFATPYDWSPGATAMEAWLGGHSQRGEQGGAAEPILRALLTPRGHPGSVEGLKLRGEKLDVPWQVRLHDRSVMAYQVHLLLAAAIKSTQSSAPR